MLFGLYARQETSEGIIVTPGGSGVFVAAGLGVTAKHILEAFYRDLEFPQRRAPQRQPTVASFGCAAYQFPYPIEEDRAGRSGDQLWAFWEVTNEWRSQFTDISLLNLSPEGGLADSFRRQFVTRPFEWMLMPPPVGAMVIALGLPEAAAEVDGRTLQLETGLLFHRGRVKLVYPEWRDRGMLTFPCFEIEGIVPGGMSGGPVFYQDKLCGIVVSSTDYGSSNVDSEAGSYVATLWPLLRANYDQQPFKNLFQSGLIQSPGWKGLDARIGETEDNERQFLSLCDEPK